MSSEFVTPATRRGLTNTPPEADHIAISKSRGIQIDWKDGASSNLPLEYLRDSCPCADCTGAHGTPSRAEKKKQEAANPLQLYKPALRIVSVVPVGNYGIRIDWNDGHNTGIYTFEYLRELGDKLAAGEAAEAGGATPTPER